MTNWESWVVPLIGAILIAMVPAMLRAYSFISVLNERLEAVKKDLQKEHDERITTHAEACRRLDTMEQSINSQARMLDRIDERTALMLSGLQQAGVVERNPH